VLTAGFDADTALAPVGDGRWHATVPASWFVVSGPNGGFLAALAVKALREIVDAPPRSLTLHYLAAPAEGPIEVAAAVERAGRTTSFARLTFEQEGRPVCVALAACAELRDGQPEWDDTVPPDVPPPEDCEPLATGPGTPPYLGNYDMRWLGWDPERRPAWIGGWMRSAQPRPLDHPLLAAMTDAWMPPAFLRMPEPLFVPTIDLTIHFRAPLPPEPHPWVLGIFTTRLAAGGVCEEDGEVWSADGRLLARSRQLAIVRRPPS
jgi:acyl-CoA thioesterase